MNFYFPSLLAYLSIMLNLGVSSYPWWMLQSLYSKGARNFIVIDSPLVGCTPNSRLAGMKAYNGGCLETANQLAVAYNDGLRQLINQLNKKLDGATILLANVYDFVLNIIQHGESYGKNQ
jgi:phospholipase/lecithinase/hemolysin